VGQAVKRFGKIEDRHINLTSSVQISIQFMHERKELCLAAATGPESVLAVCEDTVLLQVMLLTITCS
jgi:hypothetical protein